MKLSELLKTKEAGFELEVYDSNTDIIGYFYNDSVKDDWDKATWKLADALEVVEIFNDKTCSVNLWELVEKNIDKLKVANLFNDNSVEGIISIAHPIISGHISEADYAKFVDCLCGE